MFNNPVVNDAKSMDLCNRIMQTVARANLEPLARKRLTAALAGRSLGLYLPLPSSPVISIEAYFTVHHSENVGKILSRLNEVNTFNMDSAIQVAKAFYCLRYRSIYDIETTLCCADILLAKEQGDIAGDLRLLLNATDGSVKDEFTNLVNDINQADDSVKTLIEGN